MSALKFLTRVAGTGTTKLVAAITSSSGGVDGNKIIATGVDGKIDVSFLPPGVEVQVETAVTEDDLSAGDFVNIYDNGGTPSVRLAVANSEDTFASGFVLDPFLTGATATVYTKGVNTAVSATVGERSWLSATSAGDATETPLTETTDHIQQVLGIGVPSGLLFEFDDYICFG